VPTIQSVRGREILDSRGNPTIEVDVALSDGTLGRALVPSGASKGQHEALELRDGDKTRFGGKGVLKAVAAVRDRITPVIIGKSFDSPHALDAALLALDPTPQKDKLGGNSILGVSLAFARAVAASQKRPLFLAIQEWSGVGRDALRFPVPLLNVLNGGMHADNGLEFQEFMIVPHGFTVFPEALRAGTEVFHQLKDTLHRQGLSTSVGDEGGFAPRLESNEKALELLCQAIERAGYRPGTQISAALDVASGSFYNAATSSYSVRSGTRTQLESEEMIEVYASLAARFPLVSVEDGLDEGDWAGWKKLTDTLGDRLQLVGDDLFVTQKRWVEKGVAEGVANAVLIKVNQVGSLSETLDTMALCRSRGYRAVVSHRSGETEDSTISHLAVGTGCGQIKTGAPSRGERTAKYNELLRIDEWCRDNGLGHEMASVFGK